jgi:cytochrome c oxidase subunit 2
MILDKVEKAVIITSLLLMGLFVFSLLYAKNRYSSNVPECLPYDKAYAEPKVVQLADSTYQVFAVASMWQFQPSEIFIPVGGEVDFFLTSRDVVHGFHISKKNVNMMAVYGSINKTTVRFDKPGIYDIVCHEYCGIGHQNMRAQVIVNYPTAK